jgi:hypothetical protein
MQIENCSPEDVDFILYLNKKAIGYQRSKGYNLWPVFERSYIEKEVREKTSWKITDGNKIACTFSVLYSDPVIWQERNSDPAVYLHRIATNPEYKGKQLITIVRDWAIEHAKQLNKKFVRMDTWGNNIRMREYYVQHGFQYLGQSFLKEEEEHYGGKELSLLQIEVK